MQLRILITGAAGMVGSNAADYFARKENTKVIALDNLCRSKMFGYSKKSVEFNWRYLSKFKNLNRIEGDVRDMRVLKQAIGKGVDAVIHAAGQPGVPSSIRMPEEDFLVNAGGSVNLLEALRLFSPYAKLVFCSTNKVYGENVDKVPLKESASRYCFRGLPLGVKESMDIDKTGHTPYGVSKLCADLYVQEYGKLFGLNTAVFRMSCIYGPRQFGFEEQGWISWFTAAAFLNRQIKVYGNGKQVRDILYVDDLIKAFDSFISCVKPAAPSGEVYNIGGGPRNTVSLLEMLAELERLTCRKIKVKFEPWRESDQKVYVSDISKAAKNLKWRPSVGVKEGVSRLVEWTKANIERFR